MIYNQMGFYGLISPLMIIFQILVKRWFNILELKKQDEARTVVEKRTSAIDEIISGMRSVKINTWEKLMCTKV